MARFTLNLLDTFQATLNQQPLPHFRSSNNQGMLVYLLLQNDKPIHRGTLATLFWPDETDKNASNNMRQSLYQLRKLLGDLDNPDQPFLLVSRQTVQFNPESDFELDVRQFLHAIDTGDLETAVSYYQGELLPGFTCDSLEFETWLRQERETLHNLALEAMQEVAQDCLQNGRFDQAQTLARQQLKLEPWREQAHRQLMQAFALTGNRSKALAQYNFCQEVLAEELGIEPAAETLKLFEDIKAGRYGSVDATETLLPPVKARHNLPAETTQLIGRDQEVDQISQLLIEDGQRLITILGPGGIGKTRLAQAIGANLLDQFQHGVYFVDLAPLAQSDEMGLAIAATLDYQAPDTAQAMFPQLLKAISHQNLLLILDNFEHLLDGATVVTEILEACPSVTILVTSRQRLNLTIENRFELSGLDFPDWLTPEDALDYTAVQLFMENGRRAQPNFTLTEKNVNDVAHICQLVQGMPLGLVLATSWLELLSPGEIAIEIEKSFDFLSSAMADLPARQRSMHAVFDYSWQMLTPTEQAVLAKLSVFRGGFTREAAEQVADANLRILLSLVNKSLLQRQPESNRYQLHELLRQFAAQKRRKVDSADVAAQAHCHYFASLMAEEVRHQLFYWPVHIPRKYMADRDNIHRAWDYALDHGLVNELSNLVRSVATFSFAQGIRPGTIIRPAISKLQANGVAETNPAMLHLHLSELGAQAGIDDPEKVRQELLTFVQIAEKNEELELLFWAYERLGFNGSSQELFGWSEKASRTALQLGDEGFIKFTELYKLWVRNENGLSVDIEQLEELLPYFELNYAGTLGYFTILILLGNYYAVNEAYDQALHYGKLRLNLAKQWQDTYFIGGAFHDQARVYLKMDRQNEARVAIWESINWHLAVGQTWETLGDLYGIAAQFSQLIGTSLAVQILSMVYHHPDAISYYKWEIEETSRRFKEELGAQIFAFDWEKGKEMDFDTAVSLIRSTLSPAETT